MTLDNVEARVRAEFDEMPGLRLTITQASRLFGLDRDLCRTVVDRLVRVEYLRHTDGGAVTRTAA